MRLPLNTEQLLGVLTPTDCLLERLGVHIRFRPDGRCRLDGPCIRFRPPDRPCIRFRPPDAPCIRFRPPDGPCIHFATVGT